MRAGLVVGVRQSGEAPRRRAGRVEQLARLGRRRLVSLPPAPQVVTVVKVVSDRSAKPSNDRDENHTDCPVSAEQGGHRADDERNG